MRQYILGIYAYIYIYISTGFSNTRARGEGEEKTSVLTWENNPEPVLSQASGKVPSVPEGFCYPEMILSSSLLKRTRMSDLSQSICIPSYSRQLKDADLVQF